MKNTPISDEKLLDFCLNLLAEEYEEYAEFHDVTIRKLKQNGLSEDDLKNALVQRGYLNQDFTD